MRAARGPARERDLIPAARRIAVLFCALASALGAQTTRPETRAETRITFRNRAAAVGGAFQAARNGSRLIVMIVVDQLPTGVLEASWPFFAEDGFRRLAREGVSYPLCAYLHANTETAPGHATLGTGATPAVTGIVGNEWIDSATTEIVGCVEDRSTRLLSNGDPGASAHRLLVPTLGDTMKVAFGHRAKVASISIKDRSAILMAGGSADYAVWFDRKTGLFTTSTAFVAAESGPEVAWLGELNRGMPVPEVSEYLWERAAPAEAYAGLPPDDEPVEYPLGGSRTLPRRLIRSEAKSDPAFSDWLVYSPFGLDLVLAHTRFLLAKADLGKDDVPDFLGVSLSSTDYVGHLFGVDSHEVRDMTIRTDKLLGELLKHLDAVVGRGRYNVILSSDHGAGPIPEIAVRRGIAAGRVSPDRLKLAIEAAMRERWGPPPPGQHWVAKTLDADILLNRPLLQLHGVALADAQDLAARAASLAPGVAEAVPVHAILEGTLTPTVLHDAMRRAQLRARSVDVYVMPKPYHLFGKAAISSHGSPYRYDQAVPLFLAGPGFKAGVRSLDPAAPGSGVVTMAVALGIGLPAGADHPVLRDALAP